MLEKLRKKLDLNWIKKNNIWDIVVYGSYARGKIDAGDIDIAIIFSQLTAVKKKMLLCQYLRGKLSLDNYSLDIKAVDLNDFLNAGFLGRESIIAEGYSLLKKDYVAERFGFSSTALIEYSLKKLSPAKQKMLYYALQGRKKGTGILSKLGGKIISKGVLKIPTRHYEEIRKVLEQHNVVFKSTFILEYRLLHF